jgi:hypothetical protein
MLLIILSRFQRRVRSRKQSAEERAEEGGEESRRLADGGEPIAESGRFAEYPLAYPLIFFAFFRPPSN